ncbi:hypothetical protein B0H10DRAFT_2150184 [Mycena sp. CBHHK59/15]|nr:hypothetical protein B0H10DRAFT_2150184 [Mycena sp. CBHHK59/15]
MKNPQLFSGNDWIDLDDLKAWLGQQEDLKNFLNEPTILDSWQLPNDPLGFVQSQSNYHDLFDNRSDIYGTAGPSQSGSATPFSDYSYTPDDAFFLTDHSSGLSSASSEFDYSSSSTGFSTPACDWFDADASLPDAEQSWDASQFIEDTLEQQALYSMAAPIHPSFLPGSTPPSEASASISESLALHMTDPPCDGFGALLEPDPSRLSPSMLSLMSQEELNEAGDEWEWNPSETIWLDAGVSSDVYVPEDPFPVTSNCKVVRIERVHGVPSQFPVPQIATAYILNFRAVRDSYQDKGGTVMPLDAILRDQRQKGRAPLVHQQLFASLKVSEQVRCRRARLACNGVFACDSIDPSLLSVEHYELDPHARDLVNNAQIMQRLHQGSVIQDKAICFVATVKKIKCTGKDAAGAACDGYQVLKTATKELNNGRKHYFACSNRSNSWPNHSGFLIPYDVDEDLSIRLFRGQPIEPEKASPAEACSRIIGCGSGKKGKHQCPFPHKKDNNVYVAQMERHHCEAAISIYVPLDEEAVPIAIVVPKH